MLPPPLLEVLKLQLLLLLLPLQLQLLEQPQLYQLLPVLPQQQLRVPETFLKPQLLQLKVEGQPEPLELEQEVESQEWQKMDKVDKLSIWETLKWLNN